MVGDMDQNEYPLVSEPFVDETSFSTEMPLHLGQNSVLHKYEDSISGL